MARTERVRGLRDRVRLIERGGAAREGETERGWMEVERGSLKAR